MYRNIYVLCMYHIDISQLLYNETIHFIKEKHNLLFKKTTKIGTSFVNL